MSDVHLQVGLFRDDSNLLVAFGEYEYNNGTPYAVTITTRTFQVTAWGRQYLGLIRLFYELIMNEMFLILLFSG